MKEKIHPKSDDIKITCTCGAVIETTSTLCKDFTIELCSKCHPFFTGKQRIVDSTGRVERFQKRYAKFTETAKAAPSKEETKPAAETKTTEEK